MNAGEERRRRKQVVEQFDRRAMGGGHGLGELRKKVQVVGGGEMRGPAEREAYIHSSFLLYLSLHLFSAPTPTPPSPSYGGKVHYMLANQTSITSFWGLKQETGVFSFSCLFCSFRAAPSSSSAALRSSTVRPAADVGSAQKQIIVQYRKTARTLSIQISRHFC